MAGLTSRGPIRIDGNAQFTAANGVTGGSGTSADPYVIEGWDIDARNATGVDLRNTSAFAIVRDLRVHSGAAVAYYDGIALTNASNVRISNVTATDNWIGIYLDGVANVSVLGNNLATNGQGIQSTHGVNVTVAQNRIAAEFQGMILRGLVGLNLSDNVLSQYNAVGASVLDSANIHLAGNIAELGGNALSVERCSNLTLMGNAVFLNGTLRVEECSNVTATGNDGVLHVGSSGNALVYDNGRLAPWNVGIDSSSNITVTTEGQLGGVGIRDSSGVTVRDSVFTSSGVKIHSSTGVTVASNQFLTHGLTMDGETAAHFDSHAIGTDNVIGGLPIYYYRNCADLVHDGIPTGQLLLASCRNVAVRNLTIRGAGEGIGMAFVDNATVGNVTVIGGQRGIDLYEGATWTLEDLRLVNNAEYGALLRGGNGVTLRAANVSGNGVGVKIETTSNVAIEDTLFEGQVGVPSGLLGFGLAFSDAVNGRAFHNRFVGNAYTAGGWGNTNVTWDDGYPSGGNWWSDYRMHDMCSGPNQDVCPDPDGFGDVPYNSGWGATDRYPQGPPNTPPVAQLEVDPVAPLANDHTWFRTYGSGDPDGEIVEYRMDYGDGGVDTSRYGGTFLHDYAAPGTYTVALTVVDDSGANDTFSRPLLVSSYADLPIASFTVSPWIPVRGSPALLDASLSHDPRGRNLTYKWLFHGLNEERQGVQVTYVFDDWGSSGVYLKVTNDIGLFDEVRADVWVWEAPPVMDMFEHAEGRFRVPVPDGWELDENVSVQGSVVELVVVHDTFFYPPNAIAVDTDLDPTVQEDRDYLLAVADATIADIRDFRVFIEVHQEPTIRTMSGHMGVVFEVRYFDGIEAYAIVVSEEHGRFWIVGLTAREEEYPGMRGLFDLMVSQFEILPPLPAPPPQPPPLPGGTVSLLVALVAATLAAGTVAAILVVIGLARRGHRPAPADTRVRSCPNCGRRRSADVAYCPVCGHPLGPP